MASTRRFQASRHICAVHEGAPPGTGYAVRYPFVGAESCRSVVPFLRGMGLELVLTSSARTQVLAWLGDRYMVCSLPLDKWQLRPSIPMPAPGNLDTRMQAAAPGTNPKGAPARGENRFADPIPRRSALRYLWPRGEGRADSRSRASEQRRDTRRCIQHPWTHTRSAWVKTWLTCLPPSSPRTSAASGGSRGVPRPVVRAPDEQKQSPS
ncbi:hypothetical protein B0T18DRAFT_220136 [Schizothecium vesticola]|uniref:Uncharacterized protein n=1 Tax=Schizothecium vesticola TaxID=314040 RepID=A0AA40K0B0_9PEZI|nr:hypothetical protein B0T18DRAFT_220136 [Schizothecium vesticola]